MSAIDSEPNVEPILLSPSEVWNLVDPFGIGDVLLRIQAGGGPRNRAAFDDLVLGDKPPLTTADVYDTGRFHGIQDAYR